MNKRDYFVMALNAGCHEHKDWILECFSFVLDLTRERKTDYPYPLARDETRSNNATYSFQNKEGAWVALDGFTDDSRFLFHDKLDLRKGELLNLDRDVSTTYGNALFNAIALIYPFGRKIPYLEGRVKVSNLEAIVQNQLTNKPVAPTDISVEEYLKFGQAMYSLVGLTQLCVPSATEKTMTADPRMNELRAKLLEENKDHLNDPVVIAKIDAALVAIDREWLKGDPGEGFYIKDKSFNIARKAMYGMVGGIDAFGDGTTVSLVDKSLNDGWDLNKLPEMISAMREGSFSRSQQTELGGVIAKEINRFCTNFSVTLDDCGTAIGLPTIIDVFNLKSYIGKWVFVGNKQIIATEELLNSYLGKVLEIRSPIYCRTAGTDFCKHCVGDNLAQSPNAIGSMISSIGSDFLQDFLSAFHGRSLQTAHWDLKDRIL